MMSEEIIAKDRSNPLNAFRSSSGPGKTLAQVDGPLINLIHNSTDINLLQRDYIEELNLSCNHDSVKWGCEDLLSSAAPLIASDQTEPYSSEFQSEVDSPSSDSQHSEFSEQSTVDLHNINVDMEYTDPNWIISSDYKANCTEFYHTLLPNDMPHAGTSKYNVVGKKEKKCSFCNRDFSVWLNHLEEFHSKIIFSCFECSGRDFESIDELQGHHDNAHCVNRVFDNLVLKKFHLCTICNQRLKTPLQIREHMVIKHETFATKSQPMNFNYTMLRQDSQLQRSRSAHYRSHSSEPSPSSAGDVVPLSGPNLPQQFHGGIELPPLRNTISSNSNTSINSPVSDFFGFDERTFVPVCEADIAETTPNIHLPCKAENSRELFTAGDSIADDLITRLSLALGSGRLVPEEPTIEPSLPQLHQSYISSPHDFKPLHLHPVPSDALPQHPCNTLPLVPPPSDTLPQDQHSCNTFPLDPPPSDTLLQYQPPCDTLPLDPPPSDALPQDQHSCNTLALDPPPSDTLLPNQPPCDTLPLDPPPSDTLLPNQHPCDTLPLDPPPSDALPQNQHPCNTFPLDPSPSDTLLQNQPPCDTLPLDPTPSDALPQDQHSWDTLPLDPPPSDTLLQNQHPCDTLPLDPPPSGALPQKQHPCNTFPLDPPPSDILLQNQHPCDTLPLDPPPSDALPQDQHSWDTLPLDPPPSDVLPQNQHPCNTFPLDAPPSDALPQDQHSWDTLPLDPPPSDALPQNQHPCNNFPLDPPPSDTLLQNQPPCDTLPLDPTPSDALPQNQHPCNTFPLDAPPSDALSQYQHSWDTLPLDPPPSDALPQIQHPCNTFPLDPPSRHTLPQDQHPCDTLPLNPPPSDALPHDQHPCNTFPLHQLPSEIPHHQHPCDILAFIPPRSNNLHLPINTLSSIQKPHTSTNAIELSSNHLLCDHGLTSSSERQSHLQTRGEHQSFPFALSLSNHPNSRNTVVHHSNPQPRDLVAQQLQPRDSVSYQHHPRDSLSYHLQPRDSVENQHQSMDSMVYQPHLGDSLACQPLSRESVTYHPQPRDSMEHQHQSMVHQHQSMVHQPHLRDSLACQLHSRESVTHQPQPSNSVAYQPPSRDAMVHQPHQSSNQMKPNFVQDIPNRDNKLFPLASHTSQSTSLYPYMVSSTQLGNPQASNSSQLHYHQNIFKWSSPSDHIPLPLNSSDCMLHIHHIDSIPSNSKPGCFISSQPQQRGVMPYSQESISPNPHPKVFIPPHIHSRALPSSSLHPITSCPIDYKPSRQHQMESILEHPHQMDSLPSHAHPHPRESHPIPYNPPPMDLKPSHLQPRVSTTYQHLTDSSLRLGTSLQSRIIVAGEYNTNYNYPPNIISSQSLQVNYPLFSAVETYPEPITSYSIQFTANKSILSSSGGFNQSCSPENNIVYRDQFPLSNYPANSPLLKDGDDIYLNNSSNTSCIIEDKLNALSFVMTTFPKQSTRLTSKTTISAYPTDTITTEVVVPFMVESQNIMTINDGNIDKPVSSSSSFDQIQPLNEYLLTDQSTPVSNRIELHPIQTLSHTDSIYTSAYVGNIEQRAMRASTQAASEGLPQGMILQSLVSHHPEFNRDSSSSHVSVIKHSPIMSTIPLYRQLGCSIQKQTSSVKGVANSPSPFPAAWHSLIKKGHVPYTSCEHSLGKGIIDKCQKTVGKLNPNKTEFINKPKTKSVRVKKEPRQQKIKSLSAVQQISVSLSNSYQRQLLSHINIMTTNTDIQSITSGMVTNISPIVTNSTVYTSTIQKNLQPMIKLPQPPITQSFTKHILSQTHSQINSLLQKTVSLDVTPNIRTSVNVLSSLQHPHSKPMLNIIQSTNNIMCNKQTPVQDLEVRTFNPQPENYTLLSSHEQHLPPLSSHGNITFQNRLQASFLSPGINDTKRRTSPGFNVKPPENWQSLGLCKQNKRARIETEEQEQYSQQCYPSVSMINKSTQYNNSCSLSNPTINSNRDMKDNLPVSNINTKGGYQDVSKLPSLFEYQSIYNMEKSSTLNLDVADKPVVMIADMDNVMVVEVDKTSSSSGSESCSQPQDSPVDSYSPPMFSRSVVEMCRPPSGKKKRRKQDPEILVTKKPKCIDGNDHIIGCNACNLPFSSDKILKNHYFTTHVKFNPVTNDLMCNICCITSGNTLAISTHFLNTHMFLDSVKDIPLKLSLIPNDDDVSCTTSYIHQNQVHELNTAVESITSVTDNIIEDNLNNITEPSKPEPDAVFERNKQNNYSDLKNKLLEHADICCNTCTELFDSNKKLFIHIQDVHGDNEQAFEIDIALLKSKSRKCLHWKCHLCSKLQYNLNFLKEHAALCHKGENFVKLRKNSVVVCPCRKVYSVNFVKISYHFTHFHRLGAIGSPDLVVPYLQDTNCQKVWDCPSLCRDCAMSQSSVRNGCCRFEFFRKLELYNYSQVRVVGFTRQWDATVEESAEWLPISAKMGSILGSRKPHHISHGYAKYILSFIRKPFEKMIDQEYLALQQAPNIDDILWKKTVPGVREMCDICETTLFNYHWVCGICGFVACIDCRNDGIEYKWRASKWGQCITKSGEDTQYHKHSNLHLTQIIPRDCLFHLKNTLNEIIQKCNISDFHREPGIPINPVDLVHKIDVNIKDKTTSSSNIIHRQGEKVDTGSETVQPSHTHLLNLSQEDMPTLHPEEEFHNDEGNETNMPPILDPVVIEGCVTGNAIKDHNSSSLLINISKLDSCGAPPKSKDKYQTIAMEATSSQDIDSDNVASDIVGRDLPMSCVPINSIQVYDISSSDQPLSPFSETVHDATELDSSNHCHRFPNIDEIVGKFPQEKYSQEASSSQQFTEEYQPSTTKNPLSLELQKCEGKTSAHKSSLLETNISQEFVRGNAFSHYHNSLEDSETVDHNSMCSIPLSRGFTRECFVHMNKIGKLATRRQTSSLSDISSFNDFPSPSPSSPRSLPLEYMDNIDRQFVDDIFNDLLSESAAIEPITQNLASSGDHSGNYTCSANLRGMPTLPTSTSVASNKQRNIQPTENISGSVIDRKVDFGQLFPAKCNELQEENPQKLKGNITTESAGFDEIQPGAYRNTLQIEGQQNDRDLAGDSVTVKLENVDPKIIYPSVCLPRLKVGPRVLHPSVSLSRLLAKECSVHMTKLKRVEQKFSINRLSVDRCKSYILSQPRWGSILPHPAAHCLLSQNVYYPSQEVRPSTLTANQKNIATSKYNIPETNSFTQPNNASSSQMLHKGKLSKLKSLSHLKKSHFGFSRYCKFYPQRVTKVPINIPKPTYTLLSGAILPWIHDCSHKSTFETFQRFWVQGDPVLVSGVSKGLKLNLWTPEVFLEKFGDQINDIVDCKSGRILRGHPMSVFWKGFEDTRLRMLDSDNEAMLLKLKDWPPGDDIRDTLPDYFDDLMNGLPVPHYSRRDGSLNLARYLPTFAVPPDLGPKMYNAYGMANRQLEGTTNLHIDVSDAVNVMVYVGMAKYDESDPINDAIKAMMKAGVDECSIERVKRERLAPGALWHLFHADDAEVIRIYLKEYARRVGLDFPSDGDPIHDQTFYINDDMVSELESPPWGVRAYIFTQFVGDAIFIPSGAPHQVRNFNSCIKCAEDFVSPEHITMSLRQTQEFRRLSKGHTNHEDIVQIKNMLYHAIRACVSTLLDT